MRANLGRPAAPPTTRPRETDTRNRHRQTRHEHDPLTIRAPHTPPPRRPERNRQLVLQLARERERREGDRSRDHVW